MDNNFVTGNTHLTVELDGGLNNQLQMILAGLRYAKENNCIMVEPHFSNPKTLFSSVYQLEKLKQGTQQHLTIASINQFISTKSSTTKHLTQKELWEISKQFNIKKRKLKTPIIKNDIEKDFRSSLILSEDLKKISDDVLFKMDKISSGKHWACVQMRIEEDWYDYSKGKDVPKSEEPIYIPSRSICEKLRNTQALADYKDIFFTVSPTNHHEDPFIAWSPFYNTYDKTLFCEDSFSNSVMAAAIDFEIACSAPVFVGTSRSSFSNAVARNRYIRGNGESYLYNLNDDKCHLRHDAGLFPDALKAVEEDIFSQE